MRIVELVGLLIVLTGVSRSVVRAIDSSTVGCIFVGSCHIEVVGIEACLVASAPVVLKFTRAPPLLEIGATGIFGGCIVEIPRIVGVEIELLCGVVLQSPTLRLLIGHIFLAPCLFGLFFLFLLQRFYNLLHHSELLLGSHGR